MRFEKWYLDCVTADGSGMIGYAARVAWGPVALRCSELLRWEAGPGPAENRTVLGGPAPVATATSLAWRNRALQLQGEWTAVGSGMPAIVLHEEAAGKIEWRCGFPAACVTLNVAGNRREGLGYAEHLVMTIPPTWLPLRELHWGRFVGEDQSCVWIRWRGPRAREWCFHNGLAVEAEFGAAPDLRWPGHELHIAEGKTLRRGRVADTVFGGTPLLRRLVPRVLGAVEETKWCCRGVITDAGGRRREGWVIHEVATFP